MFDFEAKPISALVFDIQLNMVVFPTLERPMIPQFNDIMMMFKYVAKIGKTSYLAKKNYFCSEKLPNNGYSKSFDTSRGS